jgi:glycosyltransferase involved in cell wall biosynthesis
MIKIFYDHQKFSSQRYGGISRYFANLIQELKKNEEFDYLLGVYYTDNYYIKAEVSDLRRLLSEKIFRRRYKKYAYLVNELYCKRILAHNNFDIFHPTYYDPYFLSKLKKPMVTTIHDMTFERYPEYFWSDDPLTFQKRINIERADKIIAISQTTKNDLLNYTSVNPEKIKVVYHGIDVCTPLNFKSISGLPSKNYLLYVGDRSGYKNFYIFINAFAILHEKYPDLNIVLTGGGAMGIADAEFIQRLGLSNEISHFQVDEEELNFLYKNALLFIYPSLHEGFGLPILEAFKAECPVLLSDTECFREIGGDAVSFFDPFNLDSLVFKLEQLILSDSLRSELVKKGLDQIKKFPIEKANAETLSLYKTLL